MSTAAIRPVCTKAGPPGRAKALMLGSLTTLNVYGYLSACGCAASLLPDRVDVGVQFLVVDHLQLLLDLARRLLAQLNVLILGEEIESRLVLMQLRQGRQPAQVNTASTRIGLSIAGISCEFSLPAAILTGPGRGVPPPRSRLHSRGRRCGWTRRRRRLPVRTPPRTRWEEYTLIG